jgi:flavin reductase (DIM6/NTAB) family NADH-FMN oxidoreductase RutF
MDEVEHEFQRMVGSLDYPIYVVTTAAGHDKDGCVVGFATQCSIHPPLYLVCISDKNRTFEIAARAETMVVHMLPEDRKDLAELFGGETADDEDKLAQVEWTEGPGGAPRIKGLYSWFGAEIKQRLNLGGDHAGYVIAPVAASHDGTPPWLSFQSAKDIEPGHEP